MESQNSRCRCLEPQGRAGTDRKDGQMLTALKRWMKLMSAPAAFLQTIVVAAVFGIATYITLDDGLRALLLTLSCFVLLQIGYFAGILYMVWSESRKRRG